MNTWRCLIVGLLAGGIIPGVVFAQSQGSPSPTSTPAPGTEDNDAPQVLATSPSGAFRVVQTGEEFWLLSTANESQRSRLHSAELATPEEFDFSPDERWLYVELHHGSCLSSVDVYRRDDANHFEIVEGLNERVWDEVAKKKLMASNFFEEGLCSMARFGGWSKDSARLLLVVRGGESRRESKAAYLYYNTRTGALELTSYLGRANKAKSDTVAVCAEPVDPLPDKATLERELAAADRDLNENYRKLIASSEKETAAEIREAQRDWLKARDAGVQLYVGSFPAAEKERRRLQFLANVTRVRARGESGN